MAIDPGTFSYNCPGSFDAAFGGTRFHNTVTIDDLDQMDRIGRFLWCPWPRAEARGRVHTDGVLASFWQGYHDGFARRRGLGRHHRASVGFGGARWLGLDRIGAIDVHRFRLHWLLADAPCEWMKSPGMLRLDFPEGQFFVNLISAQGCNLPTMVRADPVGSRGWMAPTYGERSPALSVALEVEGGEALFATWLGPEPARVELTENSCEVQLDGCAARLHFSNRADSFVDRIEAADSKGIPEFWGCECMSS